MELIILAHLPIGSCGPVYHAYLHGTVAHVDFDVVIDLENVNLFESYARQLLNVGIHMPEPHSRVSRLPSPFRALRKLKQVQSNVLDAETHDTS
jgi:hypothetical protein